MDDNNNDSENGAQQLSKTTHWLGDEIEILDEISRNCVAFCRSVVAFSGFESLSMHNFVYYFHLFTHTDGSQHIEIDTRTHLHGAKWGYQTTNQK